MFFVCMQNSLRFIFNVILFLIQIREMRLRFEHCLVFLSILCLGNVVNCWESYELDLFDLVEEINQNFYEYFDVSPVSENKNYRRTQLDS